MRWFVRLFPTRWLFVLTFVALLDLASTLWWHSRGMMEELNPLMAVLLTRGEWLFASVKVATILLAWAAVAWYAQKNHAFCRRVCAFGSVAYILLWTSWCAAGNLL